ncbi:radical SAM protein [Planctomycetota bacterium]
MKGSMFFKAIASRPPFSGLHPAVGSFFKGYLAHEKVIDFNGQHVVNTHFPPYPSKAFENLAGHFGRIGDCSDRSLFSVTLAVTNRCPYNCWHCYNAGRDQQDIPLADMQGVIAEMQALGAVKVTLSGGEPLLRPDLEEIVKTFDPSSYLALNTTGRGLSAERARSLKEAGLFACGISLDSIHAEEHDRMRGREGAFDTALEGLRHAAASGLYPYFIAVATREFLEREHFDAFMRFAKEAGALEVHLLEPSATGRLAGNREVILNSEEKQKILDYQQEVSAREDLPILSTFAYLESGNAFGCGAGLTHLYIDGSGEVCPCNLVPLSFGNAVSESLTIALDRMSVYFQRPRTGCVGCILNKHVKGDTFPLPPEEAAALCQKHLAREHDLPRFFEVKSQAEGEVGSEELQSAYDRIHGSYDEFWLKEAARPIYDLMGKLEFTGREQVFEAGCGTGFATVRLSARLNGSGGTVTAADISTGMLAEARRRARHQKNIRFIEGDALQLMSRGGPYDLIFTSWVLGYIPLRAFFAEASRSLAAGGRLAFVVHKKHSPVEPLQLFGELVAEDPSVLLKKVDFDFPYSMDHVRAEMDIAGLAIEHLWDGQVVFPYDTPEEVFDHLVKSGAGTAYYDAIDPDSQDELAQAFIQALGKKHPQAPIEVAHDFVACIARK